MSESPAAPAAPSAAKPALAAAPATQSVVYHVRRYDPENGRPPRWAAYPLELLVGATVLDGLWRIKETLDPTLAWRASCRMGVCGSCAMLIQGRPGLACNTQVRDVAERGALTVAPLPTFGIIRDLVPDLAPLFEKHRSLSPFLVRPGDEAEVERPTGEFAQTPEELLRVLQFSYCIKCGACMAACPTLATDAEYLGPMPLAQAYRYCADVRDGNWAARAEVAGRLHGAFNCHFAGECSSVCPKGVDPARAIQLLKRRLVFSWLRLWRQPKPACVLGRPEHAEKRADVPAAPARTVK
jgi:succinate dehydrogenase / fumarate reductase iron-sulfur subunit